jgi:hypothetical protein
VESVPSNPDDQLHDQPAELASVLRQLLALVEACGPFDLERTRVGFAFHGKRRIFGSAKPGRSGVRGHLVLAERVEDDRRFTKIEPLTKKLYFHGFRDADQLDEGFGRHVHSAYRVGQGETDAH